MTIHTLIRDRAATAKIYAEDGAFLTAATMLRKLADDVESHYRATLPPGFPVPPVAADQVIAALRADGLHVTPSGSPGFPRWTVTQETAPGVAVCIGHRYSEAAAVELAEATPL